MAINALFPFAPSGGGLVAQCKKKKKKSEGNTHYRALWLSDDDEDDDGLVYQARNYQNGSQIQPTTLQNCGVGGSVQSDACERPLTCVVFGAFALCIAIGASISQDRIKKVDRLVLVLGFRSLRSRRVSQGLCVCVW